MARQIILLSGVLYIQEKRVIVDEIWHVLIYQGKSYKDFEISNKGNLRNVVTGTVYKQTIGKTGYYAVCVSLGGRNNKKLFKIHRCVAESFIPNPDNKSTINHIDGNKLNNNVDNLEWATYAENSQHAYKTGFASAVKGIKNPSAKFTNEQINYIRNNYIKCDKDFGCCALAKKFNVNRHTISDIVQHRSYKDIEQYISPKEELYNLLLNHSMLAIGKMYSVSDTAVRKQCKKYGLPFKRNGIKKLREEYSKVV